MATASSSGGERVVDGEPMAGTVNGLANEGMMRRPDLLDIPGLPQLAPHPQSDSTPRRITLPFDLYGRRGACPVAGAVNRPHPSFNSPTIRSSTPSGYDVTSSRAPRLASGTPGNVNKSSTASPKSASAAPLPTEQIARPEVNSPWGKIRDLLKNRAAVQTEGDEMVEGSGELGESGAIKVIGEKGRPTKHGRGHQKEGVKAPLPYKKHPKRPAAFRYFESPSKENRVVSGGRGELEVPQDHNSAGQHMGRLSGMTMWGAGESHPTYAAAKATRQSHAGSSTFPASTVAPMYHPDTYFAIPSTLPAYGPTPIPVYCPGDLRVPPQAATAPRSFPTYPPAPVYVDPERSRQADLQQPPQKPPPAQPPATPLQSTALPPEQKIRVILGNRKLPGDERKRTGVDPFTTLLAEMRRWDKRITHEMLKKVLKSVRKERAISQGTHKKVVQKRAEKRQRKRAKEALAEESARRSRAEEAARAEESAVAAPSNATSVPKRSHLPSLPFSALAYISSPAHIPAPARIDSSHPMPASSSSSTQQEYRDGKSVISRGGDTGKAGGGAQFWVDGLPDVMVDTQGDDKNTRYKGRY
ncbi:hypothetical protein IAT38_005733 [Cryptococcus sp. DSM 104549]